ncbi:MAG: (2Fe-2S)-binding protein [Rhizobiaceae bacterium]|jgi:2-furoyl-CoA dehydrogenase 2Fe-2S iron sulfur subunit|nr:MAG: (2Fe-2S)-binding protein [Rhizobiaceae bacterium]
MTRYDAHQEVEVSFVLNGKKVRGRCTPRVHLADFLRHKIHATGTHVGCEHGVCGACTVLVNGAAARSCLLYAVQVDGAEVTTIEGLKPDDAEFSPLQTAFHEHFALQCGFCTPGILMSATDFIRNTPNPTAEQVREMLSGHLCRCTGYEPIVRAILAAARSSAS